MNTRDKMYIEHIIAHYEELQKALAEINDNYDDFLNSKVYRKAITFDLFQIGELFNQLSTDIKTNFSSEDVSGIKNIRNCIAHGYVHIENDELWNTAHHDIPRIVSIIKDLKESELI